MLDQWTKEEINNFNQNTVLNQWYKYSEFPDCITWKIDGVENMTESEILTKEDHIALFNKLSKFYNPLTKTYESAEAMVERRNRMIRAIAILRTHVQAITVNLDAEDAQRTEFQRKTLRAKDKAYRPLSRNIASAGQKDKIIAWNDKLETLCKIAPKIRPTAEKLVKTVGADKALEMLKASLI